MTNEPSREAARIRGEQGSSGVRSRLPRGTSAWGLLGSAILAFAALSALLPAIRYVRRIGAATGFGDLAAAVVVGGTLFLAFALVLGLGVLATRRSRLALLFALLLVVGARVGVAATADGPLLSDWLAYHNLARGWLGGAPAIADRPMGYPILLGVAYQLGGMSAASAEALNVVAGLAAAVVVWLLARVVAGPAAAVMAVALLALTPTQLLFTVLRGTDIVYSASIAAIAALAVLLVVRLRDERTRGRAMTAVALGVVLGASAYVRSTTFAIVPFIVVLPLFFRRDRQGLTAGATVGVGLAIALAPALLMNAVHLGRLSPSTSLYTGWQFYVGANVETRGRWNAEDEQRVEAKLALPRPRTGVSAAYGAGNFDPEVLRAAADRDEVAFGLYRERIAGAGLRFLAIVPQKLATAWGTAEDAARWIYAYTGTSDSMAFAFARGLSQASWLALLVLAVVGQTLAAKRSPPLAAVVTAVVVPLTLGFAMLEAKGRYHEYVVPVLAAVGAIGLVWLIERLPVVGMLAVGGRLTARRGQGRGAGDDEDGPHATIPRRDGEVA